MIGGGIVLWGWYGVMGVKWDYRGGMVLRMWYEVIGVIWGYGVI